MTRCEGCKKYFVGVSIFDAHRVGTFSPPARRCLSTEEMRARGFASEERHGRIEWYLVANREALLRVHKPKTGISEDEEEAS